MGVSMLTKILLSCAALVAATELAVAADMYVQAPMYVPTWTGCYVGGHAGYGVATSNSYYASPASPVIDPNGFFTTGEFIQNFDNNGFTGGGQAGCQQQFGVFLWGLEGDWSSFSNGASHSFAGGFSEGGGVTFSQTFNQSFSYSSLWSVRGRFGMILSDVYHLYATAGVGGAKGSYAYSGSYNETAIGVCACASLANNVGISPSGFVIGAGAEWKIWPSFVVGAEYLHYSLASNTIIPFTTTSLNPLIALGDHVQTNNVDVVRLRASWLFNLGL
jgi:outer membrane immunogenic protein